MYNNNVLEHFQNPRNVGEIPEADAVSSVGDPTCGDVTKIYLKIADNKIVDIKYKTFGCAAAIACSSIATEMVKGKTIDEAAKLTRDDVAKALGGLPDQKLHCSNLAADAILAAIETYRKEHQ